MSFNIRLEGVDRLKRRLDELVKNPQPLLVGKTINKPHEVTCEFCEKEYVVTLPWKIERVEGRIGYVSDGNMATTCPSCEKPNECTWTDCRFNIETDE